MCSSEREENILRRLQLQRKRRLTLRRKTYDEKECRGRAGVVVVSVTRLADF